jgi:hypothetical protein
MFVEINLLPLEFRGKAKSEKKRLNFPVPSIILYIVGGLILILGAISFAVITYSNSLQGNLLRVKRLQAQDKMLADRAVTVLALMPDLEERTQLLSTRVSSKIYWWEILDQVARCCPADAILKSIKVEYDSISKYPGNLIISGIYENGTGIELTFTKNLQASIKLTKYIDTIYPGQATVVENKTLFVVKCHFRQPEEPEKKEETKQNKPARKSGAEK